MAIGQFLLLSHLLQHLAALFSFSFFFFIIAIIVPHASVHFLGAEEVNAGDVSEAANAGCHPPWIGGPPTSSSRGLSSSFSTSSFMVDLRHIHLCTLCRALLFLYNIWGITILLLKKKKNCRQPEEEEEEAQPCYLRSQTFTAAAAGTRARTHEKNDQQGNNK